MTNSIIKTIRRHFILTNSLTLACLAGLIFQLAGSSAAQAQSFSFTGRMNELRSHHTATLLADGRVLIAGGLHAEPLQTAELL